MTWEQGIHIISDRYEIINIIHKKKNVYADVKCKSCGQERTAKIHHLVREEECKNCRKIRELKEKQLKFTLDMLEINPDIELLGSYFGSDKRINCRCLIDQYEWSPIAANLLSGHGCPKCQRRMQTVSQTKDHDVFMKQLSEVNPHLELLEKYTTGKTNTKTRCRICGHIWNPRPDNLLSGFGCPQCAHKNSFYTHDQFVEKMNNKWPDIQVISTYKDSYTEVDVKCSICGCEWSSDPSQMLFYGSCPQCAEKIKHSSTYPNRVLYSVLDFMKITYIPEFKYSGSKNRFDVYICDMDTIVEMHGMQHYKDVPYWHSYVKDVQTNDAYKKSLAESHNISHYIVVDARFSRFAWILKNIANSTLPGLLNISGEKILEKSDEIERIFKSI